MFGKLRDKARGLLQDYRPLLAVVFGLTTDEARRLLRTLGLMLGLGFGLTLLIELLTEASRLTALIAVGAVCSPILATVLWIVRPWTRPVVLVSLMTLPIALLAGAAVAVSLQQLF